MNPDDEGTQLDITWPEAIPARVFAEALVAIFLAVRDREVS